MSVPKSKQQNPFRSSRVCGNCKAGPGKPVKRLNSYRESEQAVTATANPGSTQRPHSLPWRSRFFRPSASSQRHRPSESPRPGGSSLHPPITLHSLSNIRAKACDVISPGQHLSGSRHSADRRLQAADPTPDWLRAARRPAHARDVETAERLGASF